MARETKYFNTIDIKAIKEESTDTVGIFEGYANAFDNIDLGDDVVHRGAFKKTIKESKRRALFFMHNVTDMNNLLGEATNLKEDDIGLKIKGRVDLTIDNGKRAFNFIKSGIIDRMSIGFEIIKADWEEINKKLIRHIRELKLFEISLIPYGMAMNPEALITDVKSLNDIYEIIKKNSNDIEFKNKVLSLFNIQPEIISTEDSQSDVIETGNIEKAVGLYKEVINILTEQN